MQSNRGRPKKLLQISSPNQGVDVATKGDRLANLRLGLGETARALKMSRQRVSQLVDERVLERDEDGLFAFPAVMWAYIEHSREKAAGRALESGEELRRERVRLARAKADSAIAANEIAAGKYVLASDVERKFDDCFSIIRSCVMSITWRAAAVMTLTRADCGLLEDVVREALTDAADQIDGDKTALVEDEKKETA